MSTPSIDTVREYYDERIDGKIADFTDSNPRIEAAVETLAEWAPVKPKRILEIGCGIGATTWRMARAWPEAEVIGADVSPASIEVAKTCFQLPNLSYRQGLIKKNTLSGKFDFVVLMDVYEHIAAKDRKTLHSALRSLLDEECRMFFSVPTPATQQYARDHDPSGLQPVDEDVGPEEILQLASDSKTNCLYYRQVGIWNYGDYAHFVLGRFKSMAEVGLRKSRPYTGMRDKIRKIIKNSQHEKGELHDYLGTDALRPSSRNVETPFKVTISERKQLADLRFAAKKD